MNKYNLRQLWPLSLVVEEQSWGEPKIFQKEPKMERIGNKCKHPFNLLDAEKPTCCNLL